MVIRAVPNSSSKTPASFGITIWLMLWTFVVAGILIGSLAWLIPIEVLMKWAYDRTSGDDYRKFEAIGRAEAGCWLARLLGPALAIGSLVMQRHRMNLERGLVSAFSGWVRATQIDSNSIGFRSWRSFLLRGFFAAWAVLALGHFGHAINENLTNWTYFRFKSGIEVLPNISESNRAVILYLLKNTEPNSRIFVASDQKLYFLSYYLLPRRLYYQSHPDSEFVIPQPNQQRHMEAFSLAEIDSKVIDRIAPDYILEYFEQPDFVDQTRLTEDSNWMVAFRQISRNPRAEPNYLVSLRRFEKDRRR